MTRSALDYAADLLDPPEDELSASTEEARRSLRSFVGQAWPVLEPNTEFLPNWHIDLMSEYLEAVSAGEVRRLIINIPPRYMKSLMVSVMWPVWSWIDRPHLRWMFASYAQGLSTKHSVDRRTLIESSWFQERWGAHFRMASDQNVKTEFVNSSRGHMISTSFGGTATGKGGDIVVIDDPHNPKQALSDTQRASAITTFDQTFTRRLDDQRKGRIVVVMQRLHDQDLTGHLLEQDGWTHVCLPAVAELPRPEEIEEGEPMPERIEVRFPRSDRVVTRDEGDLLWPEREGPEQIAEAKVALGSYAFAGQMQQRPSPAEGGYFKRVWWRFWMPRGGQLNPVPIKTEDGGVVMVEPVEVPDHMTKIQSWDCAFKDTKASDFVAGQVWGSSGANRYLLHQVHDRLSFSATLPAIRSMTTAFPDAMAKLIEDKANGAAVIDTLKLEVPGIIAVNPEGGKEARAAAVSPQVEAGNVYLPHPALMPWVWDFIEECAAFPNSAFDDQVDGMTQALLRLHQVVPGKAVAGSAQKLPRIGSRNSGRITGR